jgi:drug/metabolite transporter (DMT)-like permease
VSTQAITTNAARPVTAGHGLPPGAIAIMLMLCVSWGFNQLAVKLALPDVPPMLQAMIRSAGALPVMLIVGWLRGVKFFERDGTLRPGLVAGLMFGIEFVLIFTGLVFTSASRASVFLYTAPFFVALGSHQFLGERLSPTQWSGLALSFAGVALAIGVPQPNVDARVLLGDLLVVGGGVLWAATTLVAKGTNLRRAAPEKALGYQAVWVVGCTFVIWFAMVKTYSASKLSAFTFITPLFGVVAAYFIMHDTLTPVFGVAALLVVAGLYLVNKPDPKVTPDPNVPA